jgi:rare lipoprotein A
MTRLFFKSLIFILFFIAGCASQEPYYDVKVMDSPTKSHLPPTQKPYSVNGQVYQPIPSSQGFVEEGTASWYGQDFHGRKTSNGETYDMYAMTAAHKTLPMNVHLKVTNLNNDRFIIVRINDRGPFVKNRVIDLSYAAAKELEIVTPGTAPVRIEALGYRTKTSESGRIEYSPLQSYQQGPFKIQVGAFKLKENADRLAEELRERYDISHVNEGWVKGEKFYRVQVGRYDELAFANEVVKRLEQDGFLGSFIVAR